MRTEIKNNPSETKDEIIKAKEQKFYEEEFIKTWDIENFPDWHVSNIQDKVYWVFRNKDRVSYYIKENWDLIFNVWQLREDSFIKEAMLSSWYFEKQEWDTYKLYKVIWFDENKKPILEKAPIDSHSKEYFSAWQNIFFNDVLIWKTVLKKNPASMFSKEELKDLEEDILFKINTWALTIEDIETINWIDEKTGIQDKNMQKISDDFSKKAIKKIVAEQLLLQCSDERLDELKQWITIKKLQKYFDKKYISVEIAENCKKAIETKEKKGKKEIKINKDTHSSLPNAIA